MAIDDFESFGVAEFVVGFEEPEEGRERSELKKEETRREELEQRSHIGKHEKTRSMLSLSALRAFRFLLISGEVPASESLSSMTATTVTASRRASTQAILALSLDGPTSVWETRALSW